MNRSEKMAGVHTKQKGGIKMGSLLNTIKRFLGNKNTVTILGVVAGVIVLWAFYSYRVNQATTPIKSASLCPLEFVNVLFTATLNLVYAVFCGV